MAVLKDLLKANKSLSTHATKRIKARYGLSDQAAKQFLKELDNIGSVVNELIMFGREIQNLEDTITSDQYDIGGGIPSAFRVLRQELENGGEVTDTALDAAYDIYDSLERIAKTRYLDNISKGLPKAFKSAQSMSQKLNDLA